MRAVITGAAGFIGSRLVRECVDGGWEVLGVDCLRPYYDVDQKRRNLSGIAEAGGFEFQEIDLHADPLDAILSGAEVVFHLAGQPGVRASWSTGFSDYCRDNILATQQLLEACVRTGVPRIVYSSSSSIYGDADSYPVLETALPRPISPYGVSKLAGEHLCLAYAAAGVIEVASLRYFTVYGPGQRPDMAIHRLIESALTGSEFTMYGDGEQIRDFTYVGDAVRANVLAASADLARPAVVNIAGGSQVTLAEVVAAVEQVSGRAVNLVRSDRQVGDVRRTGGSIEAALERLSWVPEVQLEQGIREQVEWQQALYGVTT